MNTKSNANLPDYLSYPKQFIPYKWYKPLLTLLLGLIIWLLLGAPLTFLTPGALEAIKNGTSVAAAVRVWGGGGARRGDFSGGNPTACLTTVSQGVPTLPPPT